MRKIFQMTTALLITTLTLFHATPALASFTEPAASGAIQDSARTIIGSIEAFNSSQICGWAYDTANTREADEVLIKITSNSTGETVREISADPDTQRSDLTALFGQDAAPAFTVQVDLSNLPDDVYRAAGYSNGTKITEDAYYLKKTTASGEEMKTQSLGTFRLTAYCPCHSCSEGWGRRTSSGTIATANHTVAADRRVLPAGSQVMINGVIYTVEDTGGGVRGNHIDIFFDNHAQTRQFGSRSAEVFLLQ